MIQEIELVGGRWDGLQYQLSVLVDHALKIEDGICYRYSRTDEVENGRRLFRMESRVVSPSVIKH